MSQIQLSRRSLVRAHLNIARRGAVTSRYNVLDSPQHTLKLTTKTLSTGPLDSRCIGGVAAVHSADLISFKVLVGIHHEVY